MLLLKRIFKFQKRKKTVIFAVKKRKPVLPHSVQIFDLGKYLWASRVKTKMKKIFFIKKTASRNAVNCNISTQSIPLDRNDDERNIDSNSICCSNGAQQHWTVKSMRFQRWIYVKISVAIGSIFGHLLTKTCLFNFETRKYSEFYLHWRKAYAYLIKW